MEFLLRRDRQRHETTATEMVVNSCLVDSKDRLPFTTYEVVAFTYDRDGPSNATLKTHQNLRPHGVMDDPDGLSQSQRRPRRQE